MRELVATVLVALCVCSCGMKDIVPSDHYLITGQVSSQVPDATNGTN